jgi:hypothetical protein
VNEYVRASSSPFLHLLWESHFGCGFPSELLSVPGLIQCLGFGAVIVTDSERW